MDLSGGRCAVRAVRRAVSGWASLALRLPLSVAVAVAGLVVAGAALGGGSGATGEVPTTGSSVVEVAVTPVAHSARADGSHPADQVPATSGWGGSDNDTGGSGACSGPACGGPSAAWSGGGQLPGQQAGGSPSGADFGDDVRQSSGSGLVNRLSNLLGLQTGSSAGADREYSGGRRNDAGQDDDGPWTSRPGPADEDNAGDELNLRGFTPTPGAGDGGETPQPGGPGRELVAWIGGVVSRILGAVASVIDQAVADLESGQPADPMAEQAGGRSPDQMTGQSSGQMAGQSSDQLGDQLGGQTGGQFADQSSDQMTGQSGGQASGQLAGRAGGQGPLSREPVSPPGPDALTGPPIDIDGAASQSDGDGSPDDAADEPGRTGDGRGADPFGMSWPAPGDTGAATDGNRPANPRTLPAWAGPDADEPDDAGLGQLPTPAKLRELSQNVTQVSKQLRRSAHRLDRLAHKVDQLADTAGLDEAAPGGLRDLAARHASSWESNTFASSGGGPDGTPTTPPGDLAIATGGSSGSGGSSARGGAQQTGHADHRYTAANYRGPPESVTRGHGEHAATEHRDRMSWLSAAHGPHDPDDPPSGQRTNRTTGSEDDDPSPAASPQTSTVQRLPGSTPDLDSSSTAATGSGGARMVGSGMAVPTRDGGTLTITPQGGRTANSNVTPDLANGRFLITAQNAQAPKSYDFNLDMPTGAKAVPTRDGGVDIVGQGGEKLQTIAPPWAKDAAGRDIPTAFTVNGDTLTQHVAFDENTLFPIIADPATGAGPPDPAPKATETPAPETQAPAATATPTPETPTPAATATPTPETPAPAATATPTPETPAPTATATPTPETPAPTATATPTPETPAPTATATPTPPIPGSTPGAVVAPATDPVLPLPAVSGTPAPSQSWFDTYLSAAAPQGPGTTIPPGPGTLVAPLPVPAQDAPAGPGAPTAPVVAGVPRTGLPGPGQGAPVVPGSGTAPIVVDTQGRPLTCECSGNQVSLLPPGHPGTPGGPPVEPVPGLLPGAVTVPAVPGTEPVPSQAPTWFEQYLAGTVPPAVTPDSGGSPPVPGLLPGAVTVPAVPGTEPVPSQAPTWFEQYLAGIEPPAASLQLPPADAPVQVLAPDGVHRGNNQNVIFLNTGDEVLVHGDDNAVFAPGGDGRDVQFGGDGNYADLGGGDDNYAAAYGGANTVLLGDGDRNDAVVADGDHNYVQIGDGNDNNATAGRGDGNNAVVGDGDRNQALTGAGSHNTARAGDGNDNEAIAGGPGNDNLALVGNGDRNRAIVGEGDRNLAIAGDGDDNFTRTGRGNDNATLTGNGTGNRTQVGSGQGNTANGAPIDPRDYRAFTPAPLPELAPPAPAGPPNQPGQPTPPNYGGGFPLTTAGVVVDLINNGPRAVGTLRDASTRHGHWAGVFAARAAAAGNPTTAAIYQRLEKWRTNRAEWYKGQSASLDTPYARSWLGKFTAGTGADWINRRIDDPNHPRNGRRITPLQNFNLPDRPTTSIQSYGAGEWARRGLTKVSGLFGIPAAIADGAIGVIAQNEPIPHAIGRAGSSLVVGSAGGALAAAGVAAVVPGAGWAVAGGIVAGAYVSDVWGRSGAANHVGEGFDKAGDAFGRGDVLGGLGEAGAGIGEAGAAFAGQIGQDIGHAGRAVGDFFSGLFG